MRKSVRNFRKLMLPMTVLAAMTVVTPAGAAVYVQCPGDTNQDAQWTGAEVPPANTQCMHLSAGDGYIKMADGKVLYTFGFNNETGNLPSQVTLDPLSANFPAPTIEISENNDFYLTLTNVGMASRPDLFDPHTVHFHGKANAPPLFDGMPEGSFGVKMGSSFTYYYQKPEPGTYLYHCHQEATEHMQMGMIGNLFVKPKQDGTAYSFGGKSYNKFVYNDGDGSTGYDVSAALQLSSMDHVFHELHIGIQPLPFANMRDTYAMVNGRGYPDTINPNALTPPAENGGKVSQPVTALVTAQKGQRVLLRLSNVSVTNYFTLTALGLPMKVVGSSARQLRGPDGKNLSYGTTSVTLGGGESTEVMIDTTNVVPGTYFIYTTNLNFLSNNEEDFGGMMTEIVITA